LLAEWQSGIDTSAHNGAVKAQGKTIAVLGSGFNNIYPPQNTDLFERILKNDGAVISEYPPETEKAANNVRMRNRIVSGLSQGVLVIEAAQKSGTGITVNYARKQKKPIFGLPSSVDNKKGVGTNRLLKRDGILVTDVNDILEYYNMKKSRQITIDEIEDDITIEVKLEYREIYNMLKSGEKHINQISKIVNLNMAETSSVLLMMELEGLIKSLPGNNYKIL
jgi:DNA processing protein